ncbi:unnamed protein product [Gemmata massiliana]|uniref:Uncharacterized protein n=1 Tax=Gemmata massiliana TaxID=1210884 RepID=A0A6P2CXF4_9BACT|nr:hypothetical protein [Gemmata massiliana]VTR91850.1 unnamed protein product [Gemmata massiliana]
MGSQQKIYYVPDLMRVAGRSRTWVQEAIRYNMLPKPIRVGKRNGWPKPVIDRFFGLDTEPAPTNTITA